LEVRKCDLERIRKELENHLHGVENEIELE